MDLKLFEFLGEEVPSSVGDIREALDLLASSIDSAIERVGEKAKLSIDNKEYSKINQLIDNSKELDSISKKIQEVIGDLDTIIDNRNIEEDSKKIDKVDERSIPNYSNDDFNEDYHGFTFDLETGDMLAVFPLAWWNTNVKFDKLYAAGSFMQIVEAGDGIDKTWFNLNDDRILIELPHDLFVQYQRIGNSFPEVIHSSLVHNALVYALSNLSEYQESGKLWADSLQLRLAELHVLTSELKNDMSLVYKAADMLLQDPYKRMLDSLEKIANAQNEEQED